VVMDDAGDDVVHDDDQPQDASEPKTAKILNPEWFTQPPRPPTPDLEWNKRQVVLDQPEHPWFNQMVSATKDPLTFDDLMATPIDFSKYVLNLLKIDNLTQDILLGPTYELLKGMFSSSIELKYHFQECFNALTDRLDWNNPERDGYPFDLSKPLPLYTRYYSNTRLIGSKLLEWWVKVNAGAAVDIRLAAASDQSMTRVSKTRDRWRVAGVCSVRVCGVNLLLGTCLNCTYGDGKPVTCCGCEGPLRGGFCSFCASRDGNSFDYNPNPNSFNESQNFSDYPPQPRARDNFLKRTFDLLKKVPGRIPFGLTPKVILIAWESFGKIKDALTDKQYQQEDIQELTSKILEDVRNISEELSEYIKEVKNIAEPAAKRQTHITSCLQNFKVISKESTIPLNKTPQISPVNAITHNLPTKEPEDSLIMGNEELSTIPEKESDEFIKSSVEDLIPIPRVSKDTSGSDSVCVLPSSDDFSPIVEEKSVTFSNPLFEFNDEYISNDVSPIFDEVLENIECKDSYDSNLDEPALLVTPLSDANKDECFNPGGVIDEIDAFLDMDISTNIKNGYRDSEGDIIYFKSLLIDDTSPNLPPEVFLDHDPRSLKDEPNFVDMVQVFNPGIYEKSFSSTFVKLTFEDHHYFPITFVIRIFLPYLTYSVDSSFLLSSESEDTIFDPDISAFHFSSLKSVAYENPIVIFLFFYFCPKDKGIRGEYKGLKTKQKRARNYESNGIRGTVAIRGSDKEASRMMTWRIVVGGSKEWQLPMMSKDTEDPSWSTSFKTRRTRKTSSALEDFICVVFVPDRNIVSNSVMSIIAGKSVSLKYGDISGLTIV
ncbi:hypothetical protein Tco_0506397, partial [Tanacetum coccineum]